MTAGKERRGSQSTQLVAGIHSVRNSLMQGTLSVVELWVEAHRRDQRIGEIIALAEKSGIPVNQADREQLHDLARVVLVGHAAAAVGTGRHSTERLDNQLRGRAGRQGQ